MEREIYVKGEILVGIEAVVCEGARLGDSDGMVERFDFNCLPTGKAV